MQLLNGMSRDGLRHLKLRLRSFLFLNLRLRKVEINGVRTLRALW